MFRVSVNRHAIAFATALTISISAVAGAQQPPAPTPVNTDTAKLAGIKIVAERAEKPKVNPIQMATLPVTASVTAKKVDETINLVDTEDAVKYLPSVFLRKRNNGDTQAVMGTRVWGVSSSARSLIFADGVPLTALVANNNTIGGPRWGLVGPAEIERIDMMYGPFSAAYSGNSMGAVMEITTRLPTKLEGSLTQTQSVQTFDLYDTKRNFGMAQTTADIGDRFGNFSFWASANYQKSNSQPLSYVTAAAFPSGTAGGFAATNKLNAAADVLGASGLLETGMTNAKLKMAYDITPQIRAAYTYGYWKNDANSSVDPYITKSGTETFAGQSGFATGTYNLLETHSSQSFSVRSDTKKDWDFEAVGTMYRFDKDQQRSPTTAAASGLTYGSAGKVAVLDGTGWTTLDLKGVWHAGGAAATHTVSFGVHQDDYKLVNPTYNTAEWTSGAYTSVSAEGDGNTRTQAVWAQDSWWLSPDLKFVFGGRYEDWKGYNGYNVNGNTKVRQPTVSADRFSPKASLSWMATPEWTFTGSIGKAYRFATASELYQLVTTGTTFTSPDPNLKPDNVLATELKIDRKFDHGFVGVALFQDDVHDAIISQFLPLVPNSPTLFSFNSNVDHVRARGVELTGGMANVFTTGLEFSGSVTYLDARTLALSGRASATAPAGTAVGKFLPNIPDWRANFVTTYHATERLAMSLAGRYSGKVYTTLDNTDVNPNTYQGFSDWFVADAHVNYKLDKHWSASVGADNLLNRKYFYFHPFPQRTFVGNLKYAF